MTMIGLIDTTYNTEIEFGLEDMEQLDYSVITERDEECMDLDSAYGWEDMYRCMGA